MTDFQDTPSYAKYVAARAKAEAARDAKARIAKLLYEMDRDAETAAYETREAAELCAAEATWLGKNVLVQNVVPGVVIGLDKHTLTVKCTERDETMTLPYHDVSLVKDNA